MRCRPKKYIFKIDYLNSKITNISRKLSFWSVVYNKAPFTFFVKFISSELLRNHTLWYFTVTSIVTTLPSHPTKARYLIVRVQLLWLDFNHSKPSIHNKLQVKEPEPVINQGWWSNFLFCKAYSIGNSQKSGYCYFYAVFTIFRLVTPLKKLENNSTIWCNHLSVTLISLTQHCTKLLMNMTETWSSMSKW